MARRNGPIWPVWTRGIAHTIGIDAVAGPGRIVNPRAREKPHHAPASRVTDHARASRVRAGPCAPPVRLASGVGASAGRPRAPDSTVTVRGGFEWSNLLLGRWADRDD